RVARGRVGAQAFAHLEAADLGHHDVQEDQVRMPRGDFAQSFFAVSRGLNLIVAVAEIRFQQLDALQVVVGNEDARLALRGGVRAWWHVSPPESAWATRASLRRVHYTEAPRSGPSARRIKPCCRATDSPCG